MKYRNIYSLFRAQTAKYRDRNVFYTRSSDGGWEARTWAEFEGEAHDFACALLAKGLTRGASVAILAGNIPEWTIADIGAIAAGGVGVGIYPTNSTDQCAYIINHSDAEFLFVDTVRQFEKVTDTSAAFPKLKEIVVLEETAGDSVELVAEENGPLVDVRQIPVTGYAEFLAFGRARRDEYLPRVEETGFNAAPEETAIMVYTSGTTGHPKGAMLSHNYILYSVESLRQSVPIFDDDVSFSYLPGCHVAERISGIYNRLYNGTAAHFVDDLARLYQYMLEVKPTVFASLPRFFEKIHAKIVAENGTDRVSPQTVRDAFGGAMRLLTSGGAPLPNEIAQFFVDAQLPILQAYGLTENICVAFNTAEHLKFGTVGRPMPMCDVRIAPDGEILVKSPMMFSGYYKEPEKTAEMFDADGWLKTGDLGALDDDGFLKITGRKKEIIVLSSGKNVAPAVVENLVKENHLISQCFLSGDGKSYCVALVTLNPLEAEMFARANNIAFESFAGLTRNPALGEIVKSAVEKANARLSSSEQIKKYIILERDFSLEEDEITPTLKLKRRVVADHFADVIAGLYA
ncbi:MAG: long-chain fatty acid--CoA ligase [Acidobacteria bacterium]|nr:long-chain fatty acid--CoA ligase [Acidobacteriota bacterium]